MTRALTLLSFFFLAGFFLGDFVARLARVPRRRLVFPAGRAGVFFFRFLAIFGGENGPRKSYHK